MQPNTDTWQQFTLRANTEYQLAYYGNAILMHNQALDHARHAFAANARTCLEHAIARVLISNFNLADCYTALGEISRAADCYLAAQHFLLNAGRQLCIDDESRHALEHANAHLVALWANFVKLYLDDIPYARQVDWHHGNCELRATADQAVVRH
jgi:tetratricopeptide (TPR) repeat protein